MNRETANSTLLRLQAQIDNARAKFERAIEEIDEKIEAIDRKAELKDGELTAAQQDKIIELYDLKDYFERMADMLNYDIEDSIE